MQIRTIVYRYVKALIKHVFLLNFTHELLMILEILKTCAHVCQTCRSFLSNVVNSRSKLISLHEMLKTLARVKLNPNFTWPMGIPILYKSMILVLKRRHAWYCIAVNYLQLS